MWAALATLACTSREAVTGDARLRAFADDYTAAWSSHDPARVAAHFAPDGSLQVNDGTPAVGREAITEVGRGFMTALPDMVLMMGTLDLDHGGIVYHWTLDGTNTGPGGTGRRVHISGYEEWTINADGLIQRSLGHFDEADYTRQLQGEDAPDTPPPPPEG